MCMPDEDERPWPQAGRERIALTAPVGRVGDEAVEHEVLRRLGPGTVAMMGDDPALPRMPERPKLLDFFTLRFGDITVRHLLTSAKRALDAGLEEKVVLACLLHDISNGCLIRTDHGYWGAQMVAPYVTEEVAWAVRYHQALRYFADESVGYAYPESYRLFFGADYVPPDYIRRDAEHARGHRWYMTSRLVTLFDVYFFDEGPSVDPAEFTDVIGRNFREPEEGLGFDGSPSAHMWRTMIWPHNFL
ncbi:MAG: HD domain-containing protein [Sphingomonas sp.]